MFHIGRTNTHRDFRWAVRATGAHEWGSPVDTSDRTAVMLEMRQNPVRVARAEPCGGEAAADRTVEAKLDGFDYADQMETVEA